LSAGRSQAGIDGSNVTERSGAFAYPS